MNKIKFNQKKNEKGQIIVLLAVSLVVVMVIAALAVDGGMIYTERRFSQNAADASSLAGGGVLLNMDLDADTFVCPTTSSYNPGTKEFSKPDTNEIAIAYLKARQTARLNNINDLPFLGYFKNGNSDVIDGELKYDENFPNNHGVIITCDDTNKYDTHIEVEVRITSKISTAFAHLVFPSDLATTNVAKSNVRLRYADTFKLAIITLAEECDKKNEVNCGIYFSSNAASLIITEGGLYSSNCLVLDQGKDDTQFNIDGEIIVACTEEEFNEDNNSWLKNSGTTYDWLINSINFDQPAYTDPELTNPKPVCDALAMSNPSIITTQNKNDVAIFSPGKYSAISINTGTVYLEKGLYCIEGDIKITGATVTGPVVIDADSNPVSEPGDGVTIYQYPDNKFEIEGGVITLTAPYTVVEVEDEEPKYIFEAPLFYLDGAAPQGSEPKLNGNASTDLSGLFYAPERWVYVSGTQDMGTTLAVQFIVKHFVISGMGTINIVNNNELSIDQPGSLDLIN